MRCERVLAACSLLWALPPTVGDTATHPMKTRSAQDSITGAAFGKIPGGGVVSLYTLRTRAGMEARIMTYGGIVTYLTAPDRHGRFADVVLGYDTLAAYLKSSPYFGALIGRYGNRIAGGQFVLDGVTYTLPTNDGPNTLHGGAVGFDKVLWNVARSEVTSDGPRLSLTYLSPSGEQGFPGNLSVSAVYTLTHEGALRLDYSASTDRDTVLNLTDHTYFNLRGHGDILDHRLQINADRFTPIDVHLIPIGELRDVSGTPFDFRQPTAVGARISESDEQLRFGRGYDHNWVIRNVPGPLALQATVYEPETGRKLDVLSTEPGLQFYSGNFLDGTLTGKNGWVYQLHDGFTVEPQHFPDSPHHDDFPTTILKPGETFRSTIVYRLSAYEGPSP